MKLSGISDVGKVRPNNEDNFAYGYLDSASYAVVCDGMGGVEGGEIASKIAVDTIKEQIETAYSPKMKETAIERMLISAITAANYKVYRYAQSNNLQGMGTTAVVAVMKAEYAVIAYDGDSRAYVIGNSMRQLTTDHTYLNELYRLGELTKEELETDPRKNIITRALGVSEEIEVDTLCADINAGDTILLCSDGLTNCLDDDAILKCVKEIGFDDAASVLIHRANENGGVDNITTVLLLNEEV